MRPGPRACKRSDDHRVWASCHPNAILRLWNSYNKRPCVMMTSIWLQPRANQLFSPLCCFMELSKGLQFSKKWFTAARRALKFLSVFPLTCVDCLRRRGILEGWRSTRGLVAMDTNPLAGSHLAGRKLNYLQTEKSKHMKGKCDELKICLNLTFFLFFIFLVFLNLFAV